MAQLAGVSTDYYTRLERGSIRGVSDSVLEAVASALQLDEATSFAGNMLGRALHSEVFNSAVSFGRDTSGRLPDQARYIFLDPRAAVFYPDWNAIAATTVAMLRLESVRNPTTVPRPRPPSTRPWSASATGHPGQQRWPDAPRPAPCARVGVLEPGGVDTELGSHNTAEVRGEMIDPFYEQTEVLTPEDIADGVACMFTRPRHDSSGEL